MIEILKSLTEKIKILKENQITNKYNDEIMIISTLFFIAFPFLFLLFINNFFYIKNYLDLLVPFAFFLTCILPIVNAISMFPLRIIKLFNKRKLFKLLNNDEKDFLKKQKISFNKKNYEDNLFDVIKICLNNVNSEIDFKEMIIFILNKEDLDQEFKLNIMIEIRNNKYYNEKLIDLFYKENNSGLNNDGFFVYEIYKNLSCKEIIKYKMIEKILNGTSIVKKIFSEYDLKLLVKIILEEEQKNINSEELELYNFLNNMEFKKLVLIKELILNKVLSEGNITDIEGYENDFFILANKLNLKGNLLYIMEEQYLKNEKAINLNKIQEESLKIINI